MITFSTYFTLWIGTLALAWAYNQANLPNLFWSTLAVGTLWTWGLLQYKKQIPRQTYDYVFHIFSAAVIGEDPHLFGFDFDNPLAYLETQS